MRVPCPRISLSAALDGQEPPCELSGGHSWPDVSPLRCAALWCAVLRCAVLCCRFTCAALASMIPHHHFVGMSGMMLLAMQARASASHAPSCAPSISISPAC